MSTLWWGTGLAGHHPLLLEAPESHGSPCAAAPHATPAGGQGSRVPTWARARLAWPLGSRNQGSGSCGAGSGSSTPSAPPRQEGERAELKVISPICIN